MLVGVGVEVADPGDAVMVGVIVIDGVDVGVDVG